MFNGALTLGQLEEAVRYLIEIHGRDTRIGCRLETQEMVLRDGGFVPGEKTGFTHIDDGGLMLEWVYINRFGQIVGTEGADYVPKKGEVSAIAVS